MSGFYVQIPDIFPNDTMLIKWEKILNYFLMLTPIEFPSLLTVLSQTFPHNLNQSLEFIFFEHYKFNKKVNDYECNTLHNIIISILRHDKLFRCGLRAIESIVTKLIVDKISKKPNKKFSAINEWINYRPLQWAFKLAESRQASKILKDAIAENLLNVSIGTMELLNIFVSLHKTMCCKWGNIKLFEIISGPMKSYLKSKNDLMACLVRKVSIENQLLKFPEVDNKAYTVQEWRDELDDEAFETDKIEKTVPPNILACILQVYGSSSEFIDEYCKQLTGRLLNAKSFDNITFESDQITLLKQQFDQSALQKCLIMIEDVRKSILLKEAIIPHILNNSSVDFEVQLLTPCMWDIDETTDQETFNLPINITEAMESFSFEYSRLKKLRELQWLNNYARANIDIKFKNTTKNIWCSAFHAVLLEEISNKISTIEDLSLKLSCSYERIKSGLWFLMKEGWVTNNEGTNTYKITDEYYENKSLVSKNNASDYDEMAFELNDTQTHNRMIHEELETKTWPFIEGMLMNLGAMNADKIYSSLRMFAFELKDPPFTIDELKDYLQTKVKESILNLEHKDYSLRKS
ncbi:hypothetical protein HZS_1690 [Henneguya salminicola]|nr:hypothetical protein HZS_1690 [Henneguya salminicola]